MSTTFTIGDRVTIAPEVAKPRHIGVTYVVRRKLTKNVVIEPENGGGALLRISPDYLRAAAAPGTTPAPAVVTTVPDLPPLAQGTVVTAEIPPTAKVKQAPGQLWIVIREDGLRASIVKIGGDAGRYLRVPRRWLTVVDPARITLT